MMYINSEFYKAAKEGRTLLPREGPSLSLSTPKQNENDKLFENFNKLQPSNAKRKPMAPTNRGRALAELVLEQKQDDSTKPAILKLNSVVDAGVDLTSRDKLPTGFGNRNPLLDQDEERVEIIENKKKRTRPRPDTKERKEEEELESSQELTFRLNEKGVLSIQKMKKWARRRLESGAEEKPTDPLLPELVETSSPPVLPLSIKNASLYFRSNRKRFIWLE